MGFRPFIFVPKGNVNPTTKMEKLLNLTSVPASRDALCHETNL